MESYYAGDIMLIGTKEKCLELLRQYYRWPDIFIAIYGEYNIIKV